MYIDAFVTSYGDGGEGGEEGEGEGVEGEGEEEVGGLERIRTCCAKNMHL